MANIDLTVQKTDKENFIAIPRKTKLFAKDVLDFNGIPFKYFDVDDDEVPNDTDIVATVNGREYHFDDVVIVKAAISKKDLIEGIEKQFDR